MIDYPLVGILVIWQNSSKTAISEWVSAKVTFEHTPTIHQNTPPVK